MTTALLASASDPPVPATSLTREGFSATFERCFGRVYAYVSRRVNDRQICERIVRDVLAANVHLLVNRHDERHELSQLKAASDRLIGSESARTHQESPTSPADDVVGTGDTACQASFGSFSESPQASR